jgi:EAL domain-containing protein (putative c-di-GMP-specific phosphodiesterase class I)
MLDDGMAAGENLQLLRNAGFRIALDDFGTGYSSLSYLRQFAVDKIKIDRSFVADLQQSRDARAIVAAIVTLGRAIGLTVSAEGVETEAQKEILLAAGCDQLQGFLFGMPEPALSYESRVAAE